MTRSLPEWIGKSSNSAVPPRVRLRIFLAYGGRCQCGCNRLIRPGEAWECEDTIALINGGERRESNLKPWLKGHQKEKTARDVAEKSKVYRKRAAHVGIKLRNGPPMPGSRASRFKRKMDGSVVLRSALQSSQP